MLFKVAAGFDDGNVVTEFYERRAQLDSQRAQSCRKSRGLADQDDPAGHEQPNHNPVSTLQSNHLLAVGSTAALRVWARVANLRRVSRELLEETEFLKDDTGAVGDSAERVIGHVHR